MEPEPGNPQDVEGTLNPAVTRGPDGQLCLFPRLVAKGNYSRIGIALEPEADHELRPDGGGCCEDQRVTFVEPLGHHAMPYTAYSPVGPRIAIAVSEDLFYWQRVGLAAFAPYKGADFVIVDNKDASVFPFAIPNHCGKIRLGLLHRPLFVGTRPEDTACQAADRLVDLDHESIWLSFYPMPLKGLVPHRPGLINSHHRLASPVAPWEKLKIGCGTPPVLTHHGWLILYRGVSKPIGAAEARRGLCYSAGLMVLSEKDPRKILYRSPEPVLMPESPDELSDTIANVVFPMGIDRRDDLGTPDRFDVYYGMADNRIGVACLDFPEHLPTGGFSDHAEYDAGDVA